MGRWTDIATRTAGSLVLLAGLMHLFMPGFGFAPADVAAVPEPQRSEFVFLGTYAVGLLLTACAVLTLFVDTRAPSRLTRLFLGLMIAVWCARIGLELVYPVELSLFAIGNPHLLILALLVVICLAYAVGLAGHMRLAGYDSPSR